MSPIFFSNASAAANAFSALALPLPIPLLALLRLVAAALRCSAWPLKRSSEVGGVGLGTLCRSMLRLPLLPTPEGCSSLGLADLNAKPLSDWTWLGVFAEGGA